MHDLCSLALSSLFILQPVLTYACHNKYILKYKYKVNGESLSRARDLFGDLPRSPHGLSGGLWRSMSSTGCWSSDARVFNWTDVVGFRAKKSLVLDR